MSLEGLTPEEIEFMHGLVKHFNSFTEDNHEDKDVLDYIRKNYHKIAK